MLIGLVGFISIATCLAVGKSSRKSPSRFAFTSAVKKLRPVALPPGRARLTTRPSLTGSSAAMNTADIALLRNYMASSFATSSDGQGGTLISEAAQGGSQPPLIAQPHV